MEHTYLYGIGANVAQHGLYLPAQNVERNGVYGLHTEGILYSYSGNGRCGKAAEGRDGLNVGLNTCTTARIAACNGEYSLVLLFLHILKVCISFAVKLYLLTPFVPLNFGLTRGDFTNGIEGEIDHLGELFGSGEE